MTADPYFDVDLPRVQVGSNPQHLVLGLFTDYWFEHHEHLPSAALVGLLVEFGITSTSARAAISRLTRRSLLESTREGRRTFYRLTEDARRALEQTQRRLVEFGTGDRPWDGSWTTVAFSVPEEQRDLRYVLRSRLKWLGYAPLYDGLWVSPGADVAQTIEALQSVAVASATVLRGSVTYAANAGDPLSAWDLGTIRSSYQEFVEAFTPLQKRVVQGQVGSAEALVARTGVKAFWQDLVSLDPELPVSLLPPGWPRGEAQRMFASIYDRLGPLAEVRVRQIVAEHDPSMAQLVGHRTTAQARAI